MEYRRCGIEFWRAKWTGLRYFKWWPQGSKFLLLHFQRNNKKIDVSQYIQQNKLSIEIRPKRDKNKIKRCSHQPIAHFHVVINSWCKETWVFCCRLFVQ